MLKGISPILTPELLKKTIEDLLASIVGNIQDEYDNEDEEIVAVNDRLFTVDGTTNIDAEMLDTISRIEFDKGDRND